ncbi:MAG: LysM peptidoglycan-binding domain-containing protein [Anaerolineae bacterium]|nr:LysM peptidoglycan-binding domain-containing protein [Anaerolineae bacterium]
MPLDQTLPATPGDETHSPEAVMPSVIPTNTPRTPVATVESPTPRVLDLPTITPVPPSPTITPTPEPCYQTAWAGATLFEMALKCGHVDWSVVDVILELNGMESAAELREGQTLEIPWPTATPGGEPVSANTGADAASNAGSDAGTTANTTTSDDLVLNEFGTPDRLAQYQNVEPTLRPGLAWHEVQSGETIASVAYLYGTTVEILSQVNPEIEFYQCDYGQTYGGPNCSVMLYEGQSMRVPVPIPTPESTATPSFRSPTPLPTSTYNAPYLIAPEDGTHFNMDQIVTLRWNGTGTLATNERYVVRVYDMDTGEDYQALVPDTFYSLPGGWQPDDRKRHTFRWTISVGAVDAEFNVLDEHDITEPRYFSWDSR